MVVDRYAALSAGVIAIDGGIALAKLRLRGCKRQSVNTVSPNNKPAFCAVHAAS